MTWRFGYAAIRVLLCGLILWVSAATAWAGNPRFVSGYAGFVGGGGAMGFYTTHPLYYTDPGDLSSTVTHAQADAMVAAAASVWNVAPSTLVLAQGGELAEHVSSANTYFDGTQMVFPADVQPSNYLNIQIAVIYDTDGSVIDLLLGDGASDPSGCRQTGVVESVDSFSYSVAINHAVIVLNGRCIDSATDQADQLLQMQYQLMRVFGSVLGVGWSQLNDNVFTASPQPTANQMANWPVMHPLDILCGPYTYKCMQNPFALRPDDISTLLLLYPNFTGTAPGKQSSSLDAVYVWGPVTFPTGQGMGQVNLALRRQLSSVESTYEPWELVAAVSGWQYQQDGGNPVSGPEPASMNVGNNDPQYEGNYFMPWVPVGTGYADLEVTAEAINPLYSEEYSLGPYQRPATAMSGGQQTAYAYVVDSRSVNREMPMQLTNAASSCNPGNDGTESSPVPFASSGWSNGLLCATGHSSWWSAAIKANHSWTMEVTALDETGAATLQKTQPVVGVWNAGDPTGSLPTVAAQATAMNSMSLGMTQVQVAGATADAPVRIAVSDQYGWGRPDFAYASRLLYADSVTPASVNAAGGTIAIMGMGFRQGNVVTVNGVKATVQSWTSNQIVALAPSQTAAQAGTSAVDVAVIDARTGGVTNMAAALTYTGAVVQAVSIATPAQYLAAGAGAQWNVVLAATQNNATAAGVPVVWSTAAAGFSLAPSQSVTGAQGDAGVVVSTNSIAGASTNVVTGCAWVTVCATWTVYGVDATQWIIAVTSGGAQSVAAGAALGSVVLQVSDAAGHPLPGAPVTVYQTAYAWEGACGTARCPAAPVLGVSQISSISDTRGQVTITPLQVAGGAQTVALAASTGTQGFATTTLSVKP